MSNTEKRLIRFTSAQISFIKNKALKLQISFTEMLRRQLDSDIEREQEQNKNKDKV